jgi:hypothetical protein
MATLFTVYDCDRAQLLYADPQTFIDAAKLLSELVADITAFPTGKRVMLFGHVRPDLIERLAAWGSELDDIELDADLEEEPDFENDNRSGCILQEVLP